MEKQSQEFSLRSQDLEVFRKSISIDSLKVLAMNEHPSPPTFFFSIRLTLKYFCPCFTSAIQTLKLKRM